MVNSEGRRVFGRLGLGAGCFRGRGQGCGMLTHLCCRFTASSLSSCSSQWPSSPSSPLCESLSLSAPLWSSEVLGLLGYLPGAGVGGP